MSIQALKNLIRDRRLTYVQPQRGYSAARYVYLLDGLCRRFEAAEQDMDEESAALGRVMALLHAFIHGNVMTFAMDPRQKHKKALMARTDPIELGIVDFRVTDPFPAMRLFGGFVAPDHFVGLRCLTRGDMHLFGGFPGCVAETSKAWSELFGADGGPLVSRNVNGYVTQHVLEV